MFNRAAYMKEWRRKNKDRLKDHTAKMTKTYNESHPEQRIWSRVKHRAAKYGIPFDLDISDIVLPPVCPVFGKEFSQGNSPGPTRFSPSLDKINPELGYTKGNVQVISHLANSMKQDATEEELIAFAKWVLETYD